jgi:hypothetical protein
VFKNTGLSKSSDLWLPFFRSRLDINAACMKSSIAESRLQVDLISVDFSQEIPFLIECPNGQGCLRVRHFVFLFARICD